MRDLKKRGDFREALRHASLVVTAAHYQPTLIRAVRVRDGPEGLIA